MSDKRSLRDWFELWSFTNLTPYHVCRIERFDLYDIQDWYTPKTNEQCEINSIIIVFERLREMLIEYLFGQPEILPPPGASYQEFKLFLNQRDVL